MEYRQIDPGPGLAPYVVALWTLTGESPAQTFDLVLPDGHAELVVHRTGRFSEWRPQGEAAEQPGALIAGVMERAVVLAPARRFETIGVRFRPFALAALCDMPSAGCGDQLAPAQAVATRGLRQLISLVSDADSMADALDLLRRGLERLFLPAPPPAPRLVSAVRLIEQTRGRIAIDALVERTGATSRWMERQFQAAIGLPPKRYARVVRFSHACRALVGSPSASAAEVAHRHGYYDEAHFSNEFRAFTGWAPRRFVHERLGELTRHFVSDSSKTRRPAG